MLLFMFFFCMLLLVATVCVAHCSRLRLGWEISAGRTNVAKVPAHDGTCVCPCEHRWIYNLPSSFFDEEKKEAAEKSESTSTEDERMLAELSEVGQAAGAHKVRDLKDKADDKVADLEYEAALLQGQFTQLKEKATTEANTLKVKATALKIEAAATLKTEAKAKIAILKAEAAALEDQVTGSTVEATAQKVKAAEALKVEADAKFAILKAEAAALEDQVTGLEGKATTEVAALKAEAAAALGELGKGAAAKVAALRAEAAAKVAVLTFEAMALDRQAAAKDEEAAILDKLNQDSNTSPKKKADGKVAALSKKAADRIAALKEKAAKETDVLKDNAAKAALKELKDGVGPYFVQTKEYTLEKAGEYVQKIILPCRSMKCLRCGSGPWPASA